MYPSCPNRYLSDAYRDLIKDQYIGDQPTATVVILLRLSSSISSWYSRGRSITSLSSLGAVSIAICMLVIEESRRVRRCRR